MKLKVETYFKRNKIQGRYVSLPLSKKEVNDIRWSYHVENERVCELARRYERGGTTIDKIVKRLSYRDI